MKVLMDSGGIAGTNCFLVVDETTNDCVLFDAPDHTVSNLLDEIRKNGWNLVGLWLTHGHFDHVADHQVVRDAFPEAKILIHKLDEPKLQNPNTKLFPLPFKIPPGHADGFVEDEQVLKLGSLDVEVIHTPGHAPGHVMYHFAQEKVLVGGDLIIGGTIGRFDLPDSNIQDLDNSIRRVMKLSPETRLLPGHGDVSTLAQEATQNTYVRDLISR